MATKNELEADIAQLEAEQAVADMLLQVSRDLNIAGDEEGLLDALAGVAQRVGNAVTSLMYVDLDKSGEPEWLEIVAVGAELEMHEEMPSLVGQRYYLPEFPLTNLWFSDMPEFIVDIAADDRVDENSRAVLAGMDIRSLVVLPLRQLGRWEGVLLFTWAEPHEYNGEEIEIYKRLISLISPIVANHRVITRLAQVAAERDEQQQFLRTALDASPDLVFFKDRDSVYRLCNEAFARFHNFEVNDLVGKSVFELWPPEEAKRYREEDLRSMSYEVMAEHVVRKPSGTYFYDSIKKPMLDENGEVIGLIAFERDVTGRKMTETALTEERNLLRTIIDALPDHVYAKDLQSRLTLVNLVQARSLGYDSPADLVGKSDFDLYDESVAEKIRQADQVVFQSGEMVSLEEFFFDSDGKQRWFHSVKVPLYDVDGTIVGLVGLSRDITEQKLLAEKAEQEQKQQQLIEAQKRVIQELSTPIIPVMDRVIVMPLIGSIDSMRSREITRALLAGINEYKARIVILDVTGVPLVDSGVAAHLNKTIQAARLKGAHIIITGTSDAVAETVVELGLDWSSIETLDSMQTGLLTALARLGVRLVRNEG